MPQYQHPSHLFFFNDTATTETYTLSLHDALPILIGQAKAGITEARQKLIEWGIVNKTENWNTIPHSRSEEHTSELQSRFDLVCRLLLEKKKTRSVCRAEGVRLMKVREIYVHF